MEWMSGGKYCRHLATFPGSEKTKSKFSTTFCSHRGFPAATITPQTTRGTSRCVQVKRCLPNTASIYSALVRSSFNFTPKHHHPTQTAEWETINITAILLGRDGSTGSRTDRHYDILEALPKPYGYVDIEFQRVIFIHTLLDSKGDTCCSSTPLLSKNTHEVSEVERGSKHIPPQSKLRSIFLETQNAPDPREGTQCFRTNSEEVGWIGYFAPRTTRRVGTRY